MNPHDFAPVLAAHAVNSLVLGLAISFLAWILLKALAWHNSAVRFSVLYSALLAIPGLLFLRQPISPPGMSYSAALTLSSDWAIYLLCAWAALSLVAITRIAAGIWHLRVLRRSFVPLDLPELHAVLAERQLLSKRAVRLYHSPTVRIPAALGFFRPAIVLPSWSLQELSPEELRAAVLHELAHVDRWDDWTNLAQKLIRAVLFFHPAVWWLDSRLATEREMSCDDAVLAQSSSPENYAQCLVSLAEKSFLRRQLALAQAAVGQVKQTALRIGKILDGKKRKVTPVWKSALAAAATFAVISSVAIRHVPQLVAFQSPSQTNAPAVAENFHPLATPIAAAMRSRPSMNRAILLRYAPAPATAHTMAGLTNANRSQDLLARSSQPRHAPLVNAAPKRRAPAEFMYVVMQTRDYDGTGMVKVTTSVWRLQLTAPAAMRARSVDPPHST